MNWTATKDLVQLAKQWPTPATIVAMLALFIFCGWALRGGFARGADLTALESTVSALSKDVKAGRLDNLEGQLFQARVDQCRADSDELKELYAKRVTSLLTDYQEAGGGRLSLPNCSDI